MAADVARAGATLAFALAALVAGFAVWLAYTRPRRTETFLDAPAEPPRAGPVAAASRDLARAVDRAARNESDAALSARLLRLSRAIPPGRKPGPALAHWLAGGHVDAWARGEAAKSGALARLVGALRREAPAATHARYLDAVTRDLEEATR